jgi:putative SOS response-associated peptidase YedK
MDKKELKKKVVSFHEKMRKILNQRNGNQWADLTKKRAAEMAVSYYNTLIIRLLP